MLTIMHLFGAPGSYWWQKKRWPYRLIIATELLITAHYGDIEDVQIFAI